MLNIQDDLEERLLVLGAVRYYMGRHTISVYAMSSFIKSNISNLGTTTLVLLKRDIDKWLMENPTCDGFGIDDSEPWYETYSVISEELERRIREDRKQNLGCNSNES